jgi:hypothetical protein
MRGPPSTRTALPGDEHVPRAEDWLGMGQGGGAGRVARRLAKRRAPRDPHAPPLEPPDSREAAAALEAKAFAKRGSLKAFARRSADDAFGSDGDERVHKSARAAEPSSAPRYPREPRGVLSTYARRRFQPPVAPAEAEETPPEETPGTESDRAARATLAESSAQTDFEDVVAAVRPTSPDASFPRAHSSAGRKKRREKSSRDARSRRTPENESVGERFTADGLSTKRASRDDVDAFADDGTSDDLELRDSRKPLDKRAAFLAAALAEEEAARGANRQSPDALESRFSSELALFEEMGDIAAELDTMRFARDAFDAEQAASRFAAVAESRRVELLGARRRAGVRGPDCARRARR